ncbi:MAG: anaerobic ribonucleoside-triphosphate reductase activating protein, partial [Phascolarctobacterium sp.]|nr:anaerobic ribonucleoside-triphosphate reductase activating protein [Candidatus Phascolarctobacterium caballi]
KLTLLDYPGHTACTVFFAGCNFYCPFCHNSELINPKIAQPLMDEQELLEFLQKRQGLLDGVCVSGGEPTLQPDLPYLLKEIKKLGYKIKLDTNGTMPKVIKHLADNNLVDYIAMDIKTSLENYSNLAGVETNIDAVRTSVEFIMFCGIEYEFRTTVIKNLHKISDFTAIGQWLKGVRAYYLQPFVQRDTVPIAGLSSPDDQELQNFLAEIKKYIPNASIRGK